jgi:outer membrane autotransporter protein
MALSPVPVHAQSVGGAGGNGINGAPGAGGTLDNPQGGNGTEYSGGGGGGPGGGSGGAGGPDGGGNGGDGGEHGLENVVPDGSVDGGEGERGDDGSVNGGGGGGGGAGGDGVRLTGPTELTIDEAWQITGGSGGTGGAGNGEGTEAGSGGDGGGGVWLNGGALTVSGSVIGGNGGAGGAAADVVSAGGEGGAGGQGVRADNGGAITLSQGASIQGGNGGAGGAGGVAGANGIGGAGIVGADLTVITAGQIAGGLSSFPQANAIDFTGGTNRLELQNGYGFAGNIAANGTLDILALGGAEKANFDVSGIGYQYRDFEAYEKVGASIWTLTGTTDAVTPWAINQGTLSVSSDANLGAASGNLMFDGGTLRNTAAFTTARNITLNAGGGTFQTDADLTATGVVSGAGALTKSGGGTLMLTGANTYTGGTTVSDGVLEAAVTRALGTGPVTIDVESGVFAAVDFTGSANAGSLAIGLADLDSSLSFRQNASAGSAAIDNSGRINFYDDSSAGGATITNFGPVSFNHNSTAGNATIIINRARSPLNFYLQASAGTATIINNGGFTIFNGGNTADGATITNNRGVVDISSLTTAGISIGSLSGAGIVRLGSKTLTLGGLGKDNTISGVIQDSGLAGGTGGALVKIGAGVLTLTGENTYTGGTTVNAGTLDIGGGGATGSIAGDVNVATGGTLAFNRSNDFTFAGSIGGSGAVEKLAAGTTTLTGNSGAFAGTTSVSAGTLAVNGTLGGVIDVLAGARLEGTGTVGTATIASGATIAPGNSIDTLSVAGDITFAAGSTYEVEITPALDGDLIDASGAASIDGGTVHVLKAAGTYTPGSRWTILSANGGVAGTFDTLTQNMPFVDLSLAYDPGRVYLDVARNDVAFCDVAQTSNQCATGDAIESSGEGNPAYDAIAAIPDEDSARQALDALSGEIHASIKGAMLEDSRFVRDAVNDRIRSAFGGVAAPALPVMGYGPDGLPRESQEALAREGKSARVFVPAPADTDRFAVWARGFGSWGEWDSDGNATEFERATGGIFVGADAAVAETWRVGLVTGYSRSSFHADDRASSGDSDNYHLGLFGGTSFGNLGLSLGAAHTWHEIETNRGIVFPGFADSAEASYDARTAQVFGELGYRIDRGPFAFEPFANLAYVNVHADEFAESGGAAALTGASGTTDATFATLGLRAATDLPLGGINATARGMVGWRHAFGDVTPLADFAFAGGDAFAIAGTPIAEDALVLEAGVDVGLSEKASLGISYSGQIGDGAQDHGFRADFSVKF